MEEKKTGIHKTIFNTTEKSNFIVNMTDKGFNRFACISIITGFVLITLMSLFSELLSLKAQGLGNSMLNNSQDKGWFNYEGTIFSDLLYDWRVLPSAGLGITGVLCASIFIIAVIRQTLTRRQIIPCIAAGIMFVFMYISSLNSIGTNIEDYNWFLGYRYGRYEGFMTYLCYILIFLAASSITSRKTIDHIINAVLIIGFVQCLWSILQWIPDFPGYYKTLMYGSSGTAYSLPSGFTGNPIFFASLMAVCLCFSLVYSIYSQKKAWRVFYLICTLTFTLFLIRTRTLSSVLSVCVIMLLFILFTVIYVCTNKKSVKPFLISALFFIAGIAAGAGLAYNNGFSLLDGAIIWQDGAARLTSFGYYTDKNAFDINSITSVYSYLWSKAIYYIKLFPVCGLGPDALILPQMDLTKLLGYKSDMTIDRPYNEYLFYAVTLGIPFCIGFVSALVYALVMAVKSAVDFIARKAEWPCIALCMSSVVYLIISFINTSSATASPFIWFTLGLCCAGIYKGKTSEK